MFPKEWGPYGNRHPFPEPYLAYPSGSPVKEPSLQVPIIELPQRDTSPLPGSQWGPYGERCPSPEPSFTYPPGSRKVAPLHVPLTDLPHRETPHF